MLTMAKRILDLYAPFDGRANRREFWWHIIVAAIIGLVLVILDRILFGADNGFTLAEAWAIFVILPGLAVTVRRMHDTGRSGWWLLVTFIPFIGQIIWLWFAFIWGDRKDNAYGKAA